MKAKKFLGLSLIVFLILSNFSRMVLSQPPSFRVAYSTEGLKTEDGKYKFWILVEPTGYTEFTSVSIPYQIKNGKIEEVVNVFPSSFTLHSDNIEVSGYSAFYLTVSGESPSLELGQGFNYYLTAVSRPEDLVSTVLIATLNAISTKLKPLSEKIENFLNKAESTTLENKVNEKVAVYLHYHLFTEALPAQDEVCLVSLRGDWFRALNDEAAIEWIKETGEKVILYVPVEKVIREEVDLAGLLEATKERLGDQFVSDYVLMLYAGPQEKAEFIRLVSLDDYLYTHHIDDIQPVGDFRLLPSDHRLLEEGIIDLEQAQYIIYSDPELVQEVDAGIDLAGQLGYSEARGILQSIKESLSGIKEKINFEEILSNWKGKITNVVDVLKSKYTSFVNAHADAIRYAKLIVFIGYLVLTVGIYFFPQYFPDWVLTAYTIVSYAFLAYSIIKTAAAVYAWITGAAALSTSTVVTIIGFAITALIGIYGFIRAEMCEGKTKIDISKDKASPGESISIKVSGFEGEGCLRKPVFLYRINPNEELTEPLATNFNPSETTLTFNLPKEPGLYTYWVAARVTGGKYYMENELDSFKVECSASECSIFLGDTYYGNCQGSATPCDQLKMEECSSQKGCKIERIFGENLPQETATFKCSGGAVSCGSIYYENECKTQKGCSWKINEITSTVTKFCEVTPDKKEIYGRDTVTLTIKVPDTKVKYSIYQPDGHEKIIYEEIKGFLVSCGDGLSWFVERTGLETKFTCPTYRAFGSKTTIKPSVQICSASGCGKYSNYICDTGITAMPAPEFTENGGKCYGTFLYGEEINEPKIVVNMAKVYSDPVTNHQGEKVALVTDLFFIGEGIVDAYGEISVEKPSLLQGKELSYYVCRLEPTQDELKQLLPQLNTVTYNERAVVENGQITTIKFGVEEIVNVASPLVITFETDRKSECRIVEETAMGGYGIHPTDIKVTSDSEGKKHTATLIFGETGAAWQLSILCASQDESGKTFVSTIKLPKFIITSTSTETKIIKDEKGNVVGSAAVLGDSEIKTFINITRINVHPCQIWPVQGCVDWGPVGQAYVHSNRDAYIEVITQRAGKGPYFVRFYSENKLLYEEILSDPLYLREVPQTSSYLRIPITEDKVITIKVGYFVEVNGEKVEIPQGSVTITLKVVERNEPCDPGVTRRCNGNNLEVCVDGTNWKVEKICDYGCGYGDSGAYCKSKEGATGSCYLGANPDNNMRNGGSSVITVAYTGLAEEPGNIEIDCGNGQKATASNCKGTAGTCFATCSYSPCTPATINYRVSATASGIVCEGTTIWCSDSTSGIQPQAVNLLLSVNGPTPTKVGDTAWLTLVACRGYPCVGSVSGIPVTLYLNDVATVTETTTSAGITWERVFHERGVYKFYAKFGDIQSNTLTFTIGGCTDTDGGENYFQKGVTTDSQGSEEDVCYTDGINLEEWYCNETTSAKMSYWVSCKNICQVRRNAPSGYCKDGACVCTSVATTTLPACPYNCIHDEDCLLMEGSCKTEYYCPSGCCCYVPSIIPARVLGNLWDFLKSLVGI